MFNFSCSCIPSRYASFGGFQRGISLSCLYPPLTQKIFAMSEKKYDSKQSTVTDNVFVPGQTWQSMLNDDGTYSTNMWQINPAEVDALYAQYANDPQVLSRLKANPFGTFQGQQTVFGALGDNTGLWTSNLQRSLSDQYEKWKAYNADVLNERENQLYESPIQSAARLNAAGVNSDLVGLDGVAGAGPVPSNANEGVTSLGGPSDSISGIMDISQVGLNFISTVSNAISSITASNVNSLEAGAKGLSNYNDAYDFVLKQLAGAMPVPSKGDISDSELSSLILDAAKRVDTSSYPRKERKYIQHVLRSLTLDADTNQPTSAVASMAQRYRKQYLSDTVDIAKMLGDPRFSDDFSKMVSRFGEYFTQYELEVNKIIAEAEKSRGVADKAQSDYNKAYYDELNRNGASVSEATAEKYAYDTESAEAKMSAVEAKMWQDMEDYFDDISKKDKWYSGLVGGLGKLIIPIFKTYLHSVGTRTLHMARSHSSSQNGSEWNKNGGYSSGSSNSSTSSFGF